MLHHIQKLKISQCKFFKSCLYGEVVWHLKSWQSVLVTTSSENMPRVGEMPRQREHWINLLNKIEESWISGYSPGETRWQSLEKRKKKKRECLAQGWRRAGEDGFKKGAGQGGTASFGERDVRVFEGSCPLVVISKSALKSSWQRKLLAHDT